MEGDEDVEKIKEDTKLTEWEIGLASPDESEMTTTCRGASVLAVRLRLGGVAASGIVAAGGVATTASRGGGEGRAGVG
jgi:hypothetical protein